jgi:hypothetical protein
MAGSAQAMMAYDQHGAAMGQEQQQDGQDVHVDITGEHEGSPYAHQALGDASYAAANVDLISPKACRCDPFWRIAPDCRRDA